LQFILYFTAIKRLPAITQEATITISDWECNRPVIVRWYWYQVPVWQIWVG